MILKDMIKDQCNNCKKNGTSSCNQSIVYDSTPCQEYVKKLDLSKPGDSNNQNSYQQPIQPNNSNQYSGGTSSAQSVQQNTDFLAGLFSFNGRIRRTRYWLVSFLTSLLFLPANMSNDMSEGVAIFTLLIFIPGMRICLANTAKRFHDLGKSGWYSCFLFIPIANLIFGIYAAFFKGEEFDNQYGTNPYI